ncbi:MAG: hypothetical protein U5K74_06295 [Gemmatimonadaceae bacterium]|nr:hypothetical protein [Gemmatimonadaceae bacterium]
MPTVLPLALGAALLLPDALAAQRDTMHVHAMPRRDSVSVMLTALGTRVAPALGGMARSEGLVTQPMLSARGAHGRFRYAVMLNAERWTMPDGEPVAGIWGEGFIDRRHPHTVVHEVMLTAEQRIQGMHVSVAGGKGVVPFGTDDPMIRPFTKYPANHHLMQVLERVQLAAAVRLGATAVLDAAVFNGDEPSSPTAAPIWTRFADSRAVRLTVWVTPVLEVQGSVASVRSPEFASGDGLDHAKQSASARWTPAAWRAPVRFARMGTDRRTVP